MFAVECVHFAHFNKKIILTSKSNAFRQFANAYKLTNKMGSAYSVRSFKQTAIEYRYATPLVLVDISLVSALSC